MNVLQMEATDAISAPTKKCAKKKKQKYISSPFANFNSSRKISHMCC